MHMCAVLVIEDDRSTALLIQSLLKSLGYEALLAVNSKQGVAMAREQTPGLILLDMRLPGTDGWETARALRAEPSLAEVPIIAVSVQVQETDRQRALDVGCDDYLAKPFNVNQLRDIIERYIRC